MKIWHGQQRHLLLLQPGARRLALAARAMPVAAGMWHEMTPATVLAQITMPAQCRSATGQQRAQHFPVRRRQFGPSHFQTHAQYLSQARPWRWGRRATAGHEVSWA